MAATGVAAATSEEEEESSDQAELEDAGSAYEEEDKVWAAATSSFEDVEYEEPRVRQVWPRFLTLFLMSFLASAWPAFDLGGS